MNNLLSPVCKIACVISISLFNSGFSFGETLVRNPPLNIWIDAMRSHLTSKEWQRWESVKVSYNEVRNNEEERCLPGNPASVSEVNTNRYQVTFCPRAVYAIANLVSFFYTYNSLALKDKSLSKDEFLKKIARDAAAMAKLEVDHYLAERSSLILYGKYEENSTNYCDGFFAAYILLGGKSIDNCFKVDEAARSAMSEKILVAAGTTAPFLFNNDRSGGNYIADTRGALRDAVIRLFFIHEVGHVINDATFPDDVDAMREFRADLFAMISVPASGAGLTMFASKEFWNAIQARLNNGLAGSVPEIINRRAAASTFWAACMAGGALSAESQFLPAEARENISRLNGGSEGGCEARFREHPEWRPFAVQPH